MLEYTGFRPRAAGIADWAADVVLFEYAGFRNRAHDIFAWALNSRMFGVPTDARSRYIMGETVAEQGGSPQLQNTRCIGGHSISQHPSDNCLGAVRAHFEDLTRGAEVVSDVKLIVLGNGRVGKTQICRRLRGRGLRSVTNRPPMASGSPPPRSTTARTTTRLNIWDFGGQDLYHGTHALFLRTKRRLSPGLGDRDRKRARYTTIGGTVFCNQPMSYWLAYVRHLAGTGSPVLIVQTRCDRQQDEALRPPLSDADVAGFGFRRVAALQRTKRPQA